MSRTHLRLLGLVLIAGFLAGIARLSDGEPLAGVPAVSAAFAAQAPVPTATPAPQPPPDQPLAACTITWAGGNGAWTDTAKWIPASGVPRIPTNTDEVCITAAGAYTVTLNGSSNISGLQLGSGSGAPTLLLQSTDAVQASLDVATTTSNVGRLRLETVPTGVGFSVFSRVFFHGGLTNLAGGTLSIGPTHLQGHQIFGAIVNNGNVEVLDNLYLDVRQYADEAFTNNATFTLATGKTMTLVGPFNNAAGGTMNVGGTISNLSLIHI